MFGCLPEPEELEGSAVLADIGEEEEALSCVWTGIHYSRDDLW
jgi:hypothetical protein